MAFRAYFIRKSFTGIRKAKAGQKPGLGLVWESLRQETMRSAVYTVEVSARMPPGSYTSAMIFARYTPEERRISCASAALPAPPALKTKISSQVPDQVCTLFFLQHNGQTCTLHSIIQLDVGGDGILCGGAVDRAADRLDTACFADDLLQGASSFSIAFLNHCNVLYTRHPHDL